MCLNTINNQGLGRYSGQCASIYPSWFLYLSIHFSIYPSWFLYLSVHFSIYLSRFFYLSVHFSIYLSRFLYLSVYLFIYLGFSIYLSIFLSFYLVSIYQHACQTSFMTSILHSLLCWFIYTGIHSLL